MPLVVLKLGGSLLSCADFADRLRRLLSGRPDSKFLIVVGGGAAADVVREWSNRHSLREEPAHWMALRSLSLTRTLVQELLPEFRETTSRADAMKLWSTISAPLLLDVETYLRQAELTDRAPLPHSWNVTSDSIAAWVAARWGADELILLKSTGLPPEATLDRARQLGLVDEHFPKIAVEVARIGWCNLLDDVPEVRCWRQRRQ